MIDEKTFLETLTEIFRSELDNPDLVIDMATSQSTLPEWDSLAHVRIIMSAERSFKIQFDAEEIETIDTVRALFDATARHGK